MLTVLGLLNPRCIREIVGSDISAEAISLAQDNLSLLTETGLLRRREQIEDMIRDFGKESHFEALESTDRFLRLIESRLLEPEIYTFVADMLDPSALERADFKSDIVMMDVPYGNLVTWSDDQGNPITTLLDTIIPVLKPDTVVAVSADKCQTIWNDKYRRLKKLRVGKRKIEILTPLSEELWGKLHND